MTSEEFRIKHGLNQEDLDLIRFICINSKGKIAIITEKNDVHKFFKMIREQNKIK